MDSCKSRTVQSAVVAVVAIFPIAVLAWLAGPQIIHNTYSFIRSNIIIFLGVVTAIIIAGFGLRDDMENDGRKRRHLFTLALFTVIVSIASSLFLSSYFSLRGFSSANESTQINSQEDIGYAERAPYDVAEFASTRFMGDSDGDATQMVKALPAYGEEQGVYTTSIVRRGFLQGYESTQMMNVPLLGGMSNADVSKCTFDTSARLRIDGFMPVNNLLRAVYARTPIDVKMNRNDAFVFCNGDTPTVVMPLTEIHGGIFPYRTPYGVAVYNGKTGDVSIHTSLDDAQLPQGLPVYPKSIAAKQRNSIKTQDGYTSYLFGRGGYENTQGDADSPNSNNPSEFSLADAQDKDTSHYVTPLTARGSSQNIVALSDVISSSFTQGELNNYTVMQYPDGQAREAASTVSDRIISNEFDGYRASQMSVFEVIPAMDGNWVATIGRDQSIRYRAYIAPDGTITLKDSQESVAEDTEKNNGETTINTGVDVSSMTNEEIKELVNKALDELSSRSAVEQ